MIYLALCFFTLLFSHNTKSEDFQVSINSVSENSFTPTSHHKHFLQPIKFTHHGMRCYIRHAYNHPDYGTDFLPNNFFHMVQFFKRNTPQSRNYYQSVFRMFCNKLKQSMYVNPYALSELTEEITPLLKNIFHPTFIPAFSQLQEKISSLMHDTMLQKFDSLKLDPVTYFDDLSHDILRNINATQELTGDISVEELRKSMLIFFELSLNKCIWNPNEYNEAWHSVKTLSNQLHQLSLAEIITDQDDLNSLFISLIERFCLYLDLSFAEIPTEFYSILQADIAAKNLFFLELEGEEFFETKAQRLLRAVTMAEAKTRAYHQGILVG
jgi:hypothetical protein